MGLEAHDPAAYTFEELCWWVRLLCKRAGYRDDPKERYKDLYDAGNYLNLLREHAKVDAYAVVVFQAATRTYDAARAELP